MFDSDPPSSGGWSTIAAPGTADHRTFDLPVGPPPSGHDSRRATVSGELEGFPEQHPTPEEGLFGDPHIKDPTQLPPGQAPSQLSSQSPERGSTLPSGVIPETYTTPPIETAVNATPQPPIELYQQISPLTRSTPIPLQHPPPQVIRNIAPPPAAPVPPPQLTPKQIAQAQKHCRYAISALDYEDFERAKRDLLDALKIVGG